MKKIILALFVISLTGALAFAQNASAPAADVKNTSINTTVSGGTIATQPKSTNAKKAKKNKKTSNAAKKAKNEDNKEIIK